MLRVALLVMIAFPFGDLSLEAAEPLVSNSVENDGYRYQLTNVGQRLVLRLRSIRDSKTTERTLAAKAPNNGAITEMKLATWGSGGLCAVLETKHKKQFSYSCLTMAAPKRSVGYDSAIAVFHKTATDFTIFAVDGDIGGDSVVALLGVVEFKHNIARVVTRGVVYLDDCPAPPSRGSISTFRSAGEIDPLLRKLFLDE